jgi:glc operon protein GlcG
MLKLISRPALTIAIAEQISYAARNEAQRNGWNVSISVVDEGGHPLVLLRMDGCAPVGAYISAEKARSAAIGRRETKGYEDMINKGRTAFLAVAELSRGLLEGGIPIVVEGHCVGAIGVSGVKSEQDAQIARAGLAALFA